jgi:hypothetical protein
MHQQLSKTNQSDEHWDTDPSMESVPPIRALIHPILRLQQTVGNQAVQRLLRSRTIQAKLTISQPGDIYEEEADRIAHQVVIVTTPASVVMDQSFVGWQTPEDEQQVQTRSVEAATTPVVRRRPGKKEDETHAESLENGPDFEAQLSINGDGSPLPASTRAFMEPRFGVDFSGVRLHTGSEAARLNRAIGAQAFTHGRDIYLGDGKNELESNAGKQLLAHELTHTIQQGAAGMFESAAVQPTHFSGDDGGMIQRDSNDAAVQTSGARAEFLQKLGRNPAEALRQWGRLNQGEKFYVESHMKRYYGEEFARMFRDRTLHNSRPDASIEITNDPTITPTKLKAMGYRFKDDSGGVPKWVHPRARSFGCYRRRRRHHHHRFLRLDVRHRVSR